MDINCTNHCFYQKDGKCTLNNIGVYNTVSKKDANYSMDCPYCLQNGEIAG